MSSKCFSEHDLTVLSDRDSLSDCLRELGDYEGAVKLDEETLPIRQRIDKEGEDTIATLQSLADNLSQSGKHDKAVPLYRSALATRIMTLGRKHEDTLGTKHNLASSLYELGQAEKASKLNAQILKIREELLAASDYDLIATRHNLATNHHALGNLEQAAQLTIQNLVALQSTRTSDDGQLLAVRVLQDRIQSTIRKAERARAIHVKKQAQSTVRPEPEYISDNRVDSRAKSSDFKAGLQTPPRNTKATEPQKGEAIARTAAESSRSESSPSLGTYGKSDRNPNREVKSPIAESDAAKGHPNHRAEIWSQQPDSIADNRKEKAKAGSRLGPRYAKEETSAMAGAAPSQKIGTEEIQGLKPELKSKAKRDNFQVETPKAGLGLEVEPSRREAKDVPTPPEVKMPRHKSDNSVKTASRALDALKPEVKKGWAGEGRKDAETYCPEGTVNLTKDVQQPHDGNVGLRRQDYNNPSFGVDRPKFSHIASAEQERTTGYALPASSLLNPRTDVRPRSCHEQISSGHKATKLSTPFIGKPRSNSLGARSEEQKMMQADSHAFSDMCDARDAQSRKAKGSRVKIAILDTGIDLSHPDFDSSAGSLGAVDVQQLGPRRDRVKECKSFVGEGAGDRDNVGHGTHCAALLLELSPNADIYVARVCEEGTENMNPEVVAQAIRHAADQWKVAIITMSFGWPEKHAVVADAIDHATRGNVLICAAASNDGANAGVAFPANFPPVICIHSTNEHGKPSKFTPAPLPFAPNFAVLGENVEAAWPGRAKGHSQSGTSTATPILAAVMALILEFVDQKPRKTAEEKRLRDHRVMTKVLDAMSDQVEGYRYVRPWKLMSSKVERGRVESRIQDAIGS
ncbi:MAG: hypothetical protein Q9207_004808 [Kuettlingeria erythrocarpa]